MRYKKVNINIFPTDILNIKCLMHFFNGINAFCAMKSVIEFDNDSHVYKAWLYNSLGNENEKQYVLSSDNIDEIMNKAREIAKKEFRAIDLKRFKDSTGSKIRKYPYESDIVELQEYVSRTTKGVQAYIFSASACRGYEWKNAKDTNEYVMMFIESSEGQKVVFSIECESIIKYVDEVIMLKNEK